MEDVKIGVKSLTNLTLLAGEIGNVAGKMSTSEGAAKYLHLVDLFDEVAAISDIKVENVKAEYADLDDVERVQIVKAFEDKFDIEKDQVEAAIERGLRLAIKGVDYLKECQDFYGELQGALKA